MEYIYPDIKPADIPETEDFGIEYEMKHKMPNGEIKTMITEWLWKKGMELYLSCHSVEII